MKKLLLLLFVSMMSISLFAQDRENDALYYLETESKLFDCETELNNLITQIKDDIEDGVNSDLFISMSDIEFSPEYNIFGGWMGWSISFTL